MTPKKRLEFLATALEQNAEDPKGMKFDLCLWLSSERPGGDYVRDCGTTGCAIGLAMMIPEFQKDGLINHFGAPLIHNSNELLFGFDAVEVFFNIDNAVASRLFCRGHYPINQQKGAVAEQEVAHRIREYLETCTSKS